MWNEMKILQRAPVHSWRKTSPPTGTSLSCAFLLCLTFSSASATSEVFQQGIVILEGNELGPPFVLEDDERGVILNGYMIQSRRPRTQAPREVPQSDRAKLEISVLSRIQELRRNGHPDSLLAREAARQLAGSSLVQSARPRGLGAVDVRWVGQSADEEFLLTFTSPPTSPTPVADAAAITLRRTLTKGNMIILGVGGTITIPRIRIAGARRELADARAGKIPPRRQTGLPPAALRQYAHPTPLSSLKRAPAR